MICCNLQSINCFWLFLIKKEQKATSFLPFINNDIMISRFVFKKFLRYAKDKLQIK